MSDTETTSNALTTRIRAALSSVAGRPVDDVLDDSDLFDSGILDSFGMIEFIGALEREFGISIPGEALFPQNFWSVSAVRGTLRDLVSVS